MVPLSRTHVHPPILYLFGDGARGKGSQSSRWLSRTAGGLGVGIPRAGTPLSSRDPLLLLMNPAEALPPLKIILTTLTPHICKKYAPKICHTLGVRMACKPAKIKGFSTENTACRPQKYGIQTPPFYAI